MHIYGSPSLVRILLWEQIAAEFLKKSECRDISNCRVLHIHCAPLAEISPQLRPVYNNWFLLSSNGSDNCQATIDFTRVYT